MKKFAVHYATIYLSYNSSTYTETYTEALEIFDNVKKDIQKTGIDEVFTDRIDDYYVRNSEGETERVYIEKII
jgi:nucleotidyltransferase/DNA polymerase involved in DNA repair